MGSFPNNSFNMSHTTEHLSEEITATFLERLANPLLKRGMVLQNLNQTLDSKKAIGKTQQVTCWGLQKSNAAYLQDFFKSHSDVNSAMLAYNSSLRSFFSTTRQARLYKQSGNLQLKEF